MQSNYRIRLVECGLYFAPDSFEVPTARNGSQAVSARRLEKPLIILNDDSNMV